MRPKKELIQNESNDGRKSGHADAGGLFTRAFSAKVEEVIGRSGTRGDVIQVRCKILEGRDANKIIRRNVRGPIRIGDVLMLRETEIEAQKLTQGRK